MVKITVTPDTRSPVSAGAYAVLAQPSGQSAAQHAGNRGAKRYSHLNSVTGRLLVMLVILSAIPVASNRPAWWLIWTGVLGLGTLAYLVRAQMLMGGRRALQVNQFRLFIGLALLVPMYAVVQYLPLADLLPLALQKLPPEVPDMLRPGSLSMMPDASLLGAVRAVGFILFLILVIEVGTRAERSRALTMLLMLGIFLHAIFGLVALRMLGDWSIWGQKEAYQGMLTGTFVNRNSMATFLGFGLVLAIGLAMTRAHEAALAGKDRGRALLPTLQRLEIIGLYLVMALLALAVVLTQSRMGLLASLAGALVTFVVLRMAYGIRRRRVALEAGAAVLLVLVIVLPALGGGVIERSIYARPDGDFRLSLYTQVWGMILDRPLAGFGYDAFAPAFELYRAEPLSVPFFFDLAHNTYLALWAEQGFLVGSIPILLVGWSAVMIVQRLRAGEGDRAVNGAALGVIAIGALHSLVDFSLEIPANVCAFVLIIGLAMAKPRSPASPTAMTPDSRPTRA